MGFRSTRKFIRTFANDSRSGIAHPIGIDGPVNAFLRAGSKLEEAFLSAFLPGGRRTRPMYVAISSFMSRLRDLHFYTFCHNSRSKTYFVRGVPLQWIGPW